MTRKRTTNAIKIKRVTGTYEDLFEAERQERMKAFGYLEASECQHNSKPSQPVVMIKDRKFQLFFDNYGGLIRSETKEGI